MYFYKYFQMSFLFKTRGSKFGIGVVFLKLHND